MRISIVTLLRVLTISASLNYKLTLRGIPSILRTYMLK